MAARVYIPLGFANPSSSDPLSVDLRAKSYESPVFVISTSFTGLVLPFLFLSSDICPFSNIYNYISSCYLNLLHGVLGFWGFGVLIGLDKS